jgi:hypothetical protein
MRFAIFDKKVSRKDVGMNRLNETQIASRDAHLRKLRASKSIIERYMKEVEVALNAMNLEIAVYNDVLEHVEVYRQEILEKMLDYVEGKSDDWLDTEPGKDYRLWEEEWECFNTTEIDGIGISDGTSEVLILIAPDLHHADELEHLPMRPARRQISRKESHQAA